MWNARQSFLHDVHAAMPFLFASFPAQFLSLVLARQGPPGEEEITLDISQVGGLRYEVLQGVIHGAFFPDQPLLDRHEYSPPFTAYAHARKAEITAHEGRFRVGRNTLIVLGCALFWEFMAVSDVQLAVQASNQDTRKAVHDLLDRACVLHVRGRGWPCRRGRTWRHTAARRPFPRWSRTCPWASSKCRTGSPRRGPVGGGERSARGSRAAAGTTPSRGQGRGPRPR